MNVTVCFLKSQFLRRYEAQIFGLCLPENTIGFNKLTEYILMCQILESLVFFCFFLQHSETQYCSRYDKLVSTGYRYFFIYFRPIA